MAAASAKRDFGLPGYRDKEAECIELGLDAAVAFKLKRIDKTPELPVGHCESIIVICVLHPSAMSIEALSYVRDLVLCAGFSQTLCAGLSLCYVWD